MTVVVLGVCMVAMRWGGVLGRYCAVVPWWYCMYSTVCTGERREFESSRVASMGGIESVSAVSLL